MTPKFALTTYIPKRKMRRASFEEQEDTRRVLEFKNGNKFYAKYFARKMAYALSAMDLKDTIIVCIPASCKRTNDRRYKYFMQELCRLTGAINGFDAVQVMGKRKKFHVDHVHEVADGTNDNIHIIEDAVKGRKVIVIDDIITTGKTASAFIDKLQTAGANVRGAFFLAKTKSFRKKH